MISQSTLDNIMVVAPSYSDPDTNHAVQKIDGKWFCSCQGFASWGHCHHASKMIQADATKTKDLCAIIMDLRSHARYRTFENVMDHFSGLSDEVFIYLQAVALGMAMSKPICADDLHYSTKERLIKNPRIIGSALGDLKRKGYLQIIGEKKSERAACHHRPIKIFNITDKGREYLKNGGVL